MTADPGDAGPGSPADGRLPADDHVHTQWSWDAMAGSMEGTCARAVELGVPAISFTEHVDLTRWVIVPEAHAGLRESATTSGVAGIIAERTTSDGRFEPPQLDGDGYLASVERCRDLYPDLRIRAGVELGEPHWHDAGHQAVLSAGTFERVLGSLHSLTFPDGPWIVDQLFEEYAPGPLSPAEVVRSYMAEVLVMVESSAVFEVLAHIDYPFRAWPSDLGDFDIADFEDEYRAVLRALARSGRALEVNTRIPLSAEVVGWWYEEGGGVVSFGSDAHQPSALASGFAAAAAMVETQGFRPARDPTDFWRRHP